MIINGHPNAAKRRTALTASGIVEVVPHRPLFILVANFDDKRAHLPKNMLVAVGEPAPQCIVHLEVAERATSERGTYDGAMETINAVHYKATENRNTQMSRHQDVHAKKDAKRQDDWKYEVKIPDKYAAHRDEMIDMLSEFQTMWYVHLGRIKAVKDQIHLTSEDAKPIHSATYRAGPAVRKFEKEEIYKLISQHVIEPAQTDWESPLVFDPKKDGSLRFCVDYRKWNAVTVRDSYPIPRMDECIDSLGDAKSFTTLDANCGYWQVEIDEADRNKTTFTSHDGLYRFIRMPFGLKNAPGTLQSAIDVILTTARWKYALVYLDDIVVFSRTVAEHMTHLRRVLTLLSDAGMKLKLKKCTFFSDTIDYLGHGIRTGQLAIAEHTTDAIRGLQDPTNITDLKSFLGLYNVFRRFVPNFTRIAAL